MPLKPMQRRNKAIPMQDEVKSQLTSHFLRLSLRVFISQIKNRCTVSFSLLRRMLRRSHVFGVQHHCVGSQHLLYHLQANNHSASTGVLQPKLPLSHARQHPVHSCQLTATNNPHNERGSPNQRRVPLALCPCVSTPVRTAPPGRRRPSSPTYNKHSALSVIARLLCNCTLC
jgi:hypothetical protein